MVGILIQKLKQYGVKKILRNFNKLDWVVQTPIKPNVYINFMYIPSKFKCTYN